MTPKTLAAASLALLALAGCASSGTGTPATSSAATPSSAPSATSRTTLTVLAAASLKESFDEIGAAYRATHPGVQISFSFAGSSTLAAQIVQGAPADVFAAASEATMRTVTDQGQAPHPVLFARNRMEIVTPPGNPAGVHSLADLQRAGLTVVLCQPAVPCGAASQRILQQAGLTVKPASEQGDVKSVLSAVELGEADAGIVYVTDATAAGTRVSAVPIPDARNTTTSYPISTLAASHDPRAAQGFVAFVTGPQGQKILASKGFSRP